MNKEEHSNFCIVIFCHKKDYFLSKILVASIRYYYPKVQIFLCRDYLNGRFQTTEMEKYWGVKILDLGITHFGWSSAKMHFYLSDKLQGRKVFLLDADIVFTGRVLDRLIPLAMVNDVVLSHESNTGNEEDWIRNQYYNIDAVLSMHPDFHFPGYYFNCGQLVAKSELFTSDEVKEVFDKNNFPYWLNRKEFPLVDQGILNYLLPYKEQKKQISIAKEEFFIWIKSEKARDLNFNEVLVGEKYPNVLHWAGVERIRYINGMLRADILGYFQKYYYKNIPFGPIKRLLHWVPASIDFYARRYFRKVRSGYRKINRINK